MAKMKNHEISKSLKAQGKDIKSSDLVELLKSNGFEAKGPGSNIEDNAIAFILKKFSDTNVAQAPKKAPEKKPITKNNDQVKKADLETKPSVDVVIEPVKNEPTKNESNQSEPKNNTTPSPSTVENRPAKAETNNAKQPSNNYIRPNGTRPNNRSEERRVGKEC